MKLNLNPLKPLEAFQLQFLQLMSSIRAWRGYGGMEASRAQEIVAAAHRVPTTRREPSEARTKSRRKGKR